TASYEDLGHIYNLGKFKRIKKSSDSYIQADKMFKIPNIVCNYYQLKLINILDYKFQKLYVTKITNRNNLDNNKLNLYHIHKVWYYNFMEKEDVKLF
ncbi:MAG TPA: hypothetical protein VKN14_13695, partial [Flavobacteriaceae bacterium]|nr:hypothetical protein [Flavobacteriaceae bacterium]